ncbi:hypothetical protein F52700_6862 [Fusarium sp. NRRL 52700]|nr:hypothetical protein F52700_6862 [Fusarium sp. NRRL 52700]
MGHSNSTLHTYQLSTGGIEKEIPSVIRVSNEPGWIRYFRFRRLRLFLLGPYSEYMYALDFVKGLSGDILLHSGPSVDSPILAASSRQSTGYDDYLIRLPSLSGNAPQQEILHRPEGLIKGHFWFTIQVGQQLELFEWRRSRGAEVKSVGLSRRGYKLVRFGSTKPEDKYSSGEQDLHHGSSKVEGYASDGKEVVAVWANTGFLDSLSDAGEFQFRGSGATGELGQLWALMAIMSCMSIWQKVRRDKARSHRRHGAAGSAAGSAASSAAGAVAGAC